MAINVLSTAEFNSLADSAAADNQQIRMRRYKQGEGEERVFALLPDNTHLDGVPKQGTGSFDEIFTKATTPQPELPFTAKLKARFSNFTETVIRAGKTTWNKMWTYKLPVLYTAGLIMSLVSSYYITKFYKDLTNESSFNETAIEETVNATVTEAINATSGWFGWLRIW